MSIRRAIQRAYKILPERNWDTVYWCIDLHGTCIESNYKNGEYKFLGSFIPSLIKEIRDLPETKIILWSSAYKEEQLKIIQLFNENGIKVDYFNANPEIPNTETGCFDEKFYMSIVVDDKAGFDWEIDWYNASDWATHYSTLFQTKKLLSAN